MAETLYYDKQLPEAAAGAFQGVYFKYPESEFGIKGLYTAAWIDDNDLNNKKAALKLYHAICDSFPKSEICVNQVMPLLKIVADSVTARKARKAAASAIAKSTQPKTVQADTCKVGSSVPADTAKATLPKVIPSADSGAVSPNPGTGNTGSPPMAQIKDTMPKPGADSTKNTISPKSTADTAVHPSVIPDSVVHSGIPPAQLQQQRLMRSREQSAIHATDSLPAVQPPAPVAPSARVQPDSVHKVQDTASVKVLSPQLQKKEENTKSQ
jgi:hypothetical protein